MRKSSRFTVILGMRFAAYALTLIAILLVFSPCPTRADSVITQTISLSQVSTAPQSVSFTFSNFDTALGTLDSVMLNATATTNLILSPTSSETDDVFVVVSDSDTAIGAEIECVISPPSTGPCMDSDVNLIDSSSNAFLLPDFQSGPGDTFTASVTDTQGYEFDTTATFTLVYDYTPVAMPEPSSAGLMLLGVGLVLLMRKRIGQRLPQAS